MISRFCFAKYSSSFLLGFSSVGIVARSGLPIENIYRLRSHTGEIDLEIRRECSERLPGTGPRHSGGACQGNDAVVVPDEGSDTRPTWHSVERRIEARLRDTH